MVHTPATARGPRTTTGSSARSGTAEAIGVIPEVGGGSPRGRDAVSRAPVRRPSAGGNSPARLEALAAGPVGIVARLVAVGLTHLFATGIRATTVNLAVSLRVG